MNHQQLDKPYRGKILVVDDRPENLLAIETALKHVDVEIFTAGSGNEALSLMLRHELALVLLDVQMPEMDGFEVASLMCDNETTKHIPIIFVTAISKDDEFVFKGYKSGAVDYLFKPLSPEILQAKVRVFLELDRQKRELELAQIEAQAASLAKTEFLANMSHEIRTPMTAILGFADTLLTEGDIHQAPPKRIEAIQTIIRNGQHLLNLINGILDLSKIEAGKLELETVRCPVLRLISDVVALMQNRADARRIGLKVKVDGQIPETIQTDPTRLRQVLINLVGNAIKFTDTGHVALEVSMSDDDQSEQSIHFDITDTGIGIAPDKIPKLFNAFSQADSSTTRVFGGTGLGLAISKRLAEMLGGTISATSRPGSGSTFRVTVGAGSLEGVPMLDPKDCKIEHAPLPQQAGELAPDELCDCRLLLAEDGPDNQRLISFLLEKVGAEVIVAEDGQIAFDKATEAEEAGQPFDAILMDMQMPVLDGYAATEKLRSQGYAGPIIALTANAMDGDREKCLQAGCDAYASKPIDRTQLIAAIANMVGRHKSLHAKSEHEV